MDKVFALHDGHAYFQKGKKWRRCKVVEGGVVLTSATADIKPLELFTLQEVTARIGLTPADAKPPSPEPFPEEDVAEPGEQPEE